VAYTLLGHTFAQSSGGGAVTTGAVDTSGADLIVVGVSSYDGTLTVTDSKSNTWTLQQNGLFDNGTANQGAFHENANLASIWKLPVRVRIIRMAFPTRAEGSQMAVRLRNGADAESLVARGSRKGVRYLYEIAAASDSALFARAVRYGAGAVLGPDSLAAGWEVVRVHEILPARIREFDEVRELVQHAWYNDQGERFMRSYLDGLRKRTRVVMNERAIATLTKR
jgi:hypothetical protein